MGFRYISSSAADCRCPSASSSAKPSDPHGGESSGSGGAKDSHDASSNSSADPCPCAADHSSSADSGGRQERATPGDTACASSNSCASTSANLHHRMWSSCSCTSLPGAASLGCTHTL